MKINSAMNIVAEIGKKSAIKNTELWCRFWLHQPKIPAKLLSLKNMK